VTPNSKSTGMCVAMRRVGATAGAGRAPARDKRYPLASWWSGSGETKNTRSRGNAPSQSATSSANLERAGNGAGETRRPKGGRYFVHRPPQAGIFDESHAAMTLLPSPEAATRAFWRRQRRAGSSSKTSRPEVR
jgi:hypothetical protein